MAGFSAGWLISAPQSVNWAAQLSLRIQDGFTRVPGIWCWLLAEAM